jgi:sterol desaturase/sphingolipid hydroxylase (fatty acid hydroxylase superfamily)
LTQFFATYFGFLSGIYSITYAVVNGIVLRLGFAAEILLIYLAIETVIPKTRNSLASTLRSALYVTASMTINVLLFSVLIEYFDKDRLHGFFLLDLTSLTDSPYLPFRIVGWITAAFAASFIGNVFYYWFHRAQHAVPTLWRFHRVHHSITEMSAVSSYHHFTDDMLQYFAVGVPTALLLKVDSGAIPWLVAVVVGTHQYFIHSSMNVNIGPLRYIIGDNHFHRIHHSREVRHFDKNFGTFTPIWDVLFRTAYFPKKSEWPDVGLAHVPEPMRIRDYLLMPFYNLDGQGQRGHMSTTQARQPGE